MDHHYVHPAIWLRQWNNQLYCRRQYDGGCQNRFSQHSRTDFHRHTDGPTDDRGNHLYAEHINRGRHYYGERYSHVRLTGYLHVNNPHYLHSVNGSTVTGVATGTCTIAANQAGNSSYDPAPQVTGSITVACQTVTINTTSLPNGRVGTAYSQTLSASGGTITSWAISSGSLPGGLSLNTSTGVISGMPTTGGIFNFTVKATNGCGSTGTQTLSIGIAFNPYQVYAGTGAPMYYVSGSCQTLNSGSYVNLSYNNSVTFYRNSGCTTGSTYTVTYSLANTTDVNANGQVTVNRNGNNWSLVDR